MSYESSCIHGRFTERHCEECEQEAREHQNCRKEVAEVCLAHQLETKKLQDALAELVGFARRNEERAKMAMLDAQKKFKPFPSAESEQLRVMEARYHEAVRVHMTIKMRVAEALR